MKKVIIIFMAIFMNMAESLCQDGIGQYRERGYKGSIAIVDEDFYLVGLEISQGYMFDGRNYLGIAGRATQALHYNYHLSLCADYHLYTSLQKNSPVIGLKGGIMYSPFNVSIENYCFVEPNIGWSSSLRNGKGLTLTAGLPIYPLAIGTDGQKLGLTLSLHYEW